MAYVITDDCALCMACIEECPNEAITEGDEKVNIDPEKCTECVGFYSEAKCAEVCPSDAAQPDADRKEDRDTLLARFRQLHPDREPAEA